MNLLLLRVGAMLLLAASLFVGGCMHGKSSQRASDQKALLDAAQQLGASSAALRASASVLREVDAQTLAAQRAANARAAIAAALVQSAQRDATTYRQRNAQIESDLAAAKRDAGCKRLLETPTCAVFR